MKLKIHLAREATSPVSSLKPLEVFIVDYVPYIKISDQEVAGFGTIENASLNLQTGELIAFFATTEVEMCEANLTLS